MTPEEKYQYKIDELNDKKLKLQQKVILLVDNIDKLDTEIEKLEKKEIDRLGHIYIKQIVNEVTGIMITPDETNPN